jgi:hypothetical protein
VIESTNIEASRVVTPKEKQSDSPISQNILRPKKLADYI